MGFRVAGGVVLGWRAEGVCWVSWLGAGGGYSRAHHTSMGAGEFLAHSIQVIYSNGTCRVVGVSMWGDLPTRFWGRSFWLGSSTHDKSCNMTPSGIVSLWWNGLVAIDVWWWSYSESSHALVVGVAIAVWFKWGYSGVCGFNSLKCNCTSSECWNPPHWGYKVLSQGIYQESQRE